MLNRTGSIPNPEFPKSDFETLQIVDFGDVGIGLKYDEAYLTMLKVDAPVGGKEVLFSKERKLYPNFYQVRKLSESQCKSFEKFTEQWKGDKDNGLADSRLQKYALVFYHQKKVVLTIAPNLTGSDMYVQAFENDGKSFDGSMNGKQWKAFHYLVYTVYSLSPDKDIGSLPYYKVEPKRRAR